MNDLDDHDDPAITLALASFFSLVVVGGVVDLILDRPTTLLSLHILLEVGMVAVSLFAVTYLSRGWLRARRLLAEAKRRSETTNRERVEWEGRAGPLLEGLGEAVSTQFEAWTLTPAERRTALMLLKGLSHKRIASLTETSERTVRQHSVAVYRKSGVAGRAGLAGFFLDALLLPGETDAAEVGGAERASGGG